MNEQWTDRRIKAEIRANAEYKLGEAIDIDEAVKIIRRMRDDMQAEHSSILREHVKLKAELDNVLNTSRATIDALNVKLAQLLKDSETLEALQECGVDNWEGYDEAMQLLREWQQ